MSNTNNFRREFFEKWYLFLLVALEEVEQQSY
jgi:hypothetical protein